MKKLSLIVLVLVLAVASSTSESDCLKKVSWLSGTWKMQDKDKTIIEEWTGHEGSMKCRTFEVNGQDTTLIENASLSCIAGKTVFTYHPILKDAADTRQPVNFVLVSDENNTYVFENKAHDFPQRVVYQKKSDTECNAWIEGEENGKISRIDFVYKKTVR